MVANIHYRWDFIGLSTDTKPTPASSEKVVDGSTYYCSDNSKLYVWYKDQWYEKTVSGGGGTDYTAGEGIDITGTTISVDTTTIQPKLTAGSNITISDNTISATDTTYSNFTGTDGTAAGTAGLVPAPAATDAGKFLKADGTWDTAGGASYTAGDGIDITNNVIKATNTGKAKALTSADYNYPASGTKTSVALWLLDPGVYVSGESPIAFKDNITNNWALYQGTMLIVSKTGSNGEYTIGMWGSDENASGWRFAKVSTSTGTATIVTSNLPVGLTDNLTSTSTTRALTAKQGKALNDKITGLAISGAGAPTTSTVGTIGKLYEDTTNGKLYICTAIVPGTDPDPDTYTWVEVGAGGGSGVIELTSADYNANSANWADTDPTNFNCIALWKLEPGVYYSTLENNGYSLLYTSKNNRSGLDPIVLTHKNLAGTYVQLTIIDKSGAQTFDTVNISTGVSNGHVTNITNDYLIQSTGTSTSAVMSQNATTSMVFADPSTKEKVQIGYSASATGSNATAIGGKAISSGTGAIALASNYDTTTASGRNSLALGTRASAPQRGSVAIGSYSGGNISTSGTVDMGTSDTSDGYNSSNYRLLTGLYDPQSAHDAATKGYVDGLATMGTLSATPTGTTAGVPGRLYTYDTGGGSYEVYLCIHDNGDDTYVWKQVSLI